MDFFKVDILVKIVKFTSPESLPTNENLAKSPLRTNVSCKYNYCSVM